MNHPLTSFAEILNWLYRNKTGTVPVFVIVMLFISAACSVQRQPGKAVNQDEKISITLLQLNDVYEISPLDSGRVGGLARLATLRKSLLKDNPNTFTLLAGDFISPSAIATLQYDDLRMAGRQMVQVLNATGIDLVTFGNHEFDWNQFELQKCIDLSTFNWISANVKPLMASGRLVKRHNGRKEAIPSVYIKQFTDADGTTARIGFIGVTLETGAGKKYIEYEDYLLAAGEAMKELQGNCDFIIALTHLSIAQDIELAKRFPGLKMILGGHEHVNSDTTIGTVRILKADANAKTVYQHFLDYNATTHRLDIQSKLEYVTDKISNDAAVQAIVDDWNSKATELLTKQKKTQPCEVIARLPQTFDGTESSVRSRPTKLTLAIAESMMKFATDSGLSVDCALYNSGSIRLDDSLKGTITYYDLFRTLPYPTTIRVDTVKGSVLMRLLDIGSSKPGEGYFLQHDAGVNKSAGRWRIGESIIDENRFYNVVMNTYLSEGNQDMMQFMESDNKRRGKKTADLLAVLKDYLKLKYPAGAVAGGRNRIIPCY